MEGGKQARIFSEGGREGGRKEGRKEGSKEARKKRRRVDIKTMITQCSERVISQFLHR